MVLASIMIWLGRWTNEIREREIKSIWSMFYLHDFNACCCWWQTPFTSFPIFAIMSLPTLLLHVDNESDRPSIDNSNASCNAAADDDDVGDNNCCCCCCFRFFWPQTLSAFCAFVRSISENNTDIVAKFYVFLSIYINRRDCWMLFSREMFYVFVFCFCIFGVFVRCRFWYRYIFFFIFCFGWVN